ncbi:MAG: peptide chain release factor N(5)-glutamine methyltransferase [Phycisphaerae bacterium]
MMKPPAIAETTESPEWTVGRLLQWTQAHFDARGIDQPRLSAELRLAEALGCQKIDLYTRFDQVPPDDRRTCFRALLVRVAATEPIAYVLGRREFFSLMFHVTPDVLIPRPETETLVERGLAFCRAIDDEQVHVMDIGTGSGCIAVAMARFESRAAVVASDVSTAALAVAQANAERHDVRARILFVEADGPALPADAAPVGGFHLILSNPPYIAESAFDKLPGNVRDFEPRIALVAGDGLAFYRLLAARGAALLRQGGRCAVEIGLGQADAVVEIFAAAAEFAHVGSYRDLAGMKRVLAFERRS